MKFNIINTQFFKEWRADGLRILLDITSQDFYRYKVQRFNGCCWDDIRGYHTLRQAKEAVAWIAEDRAMEAGLIH